MAEIRTATTLACDQIRRIARPISLAMMYSSFGDCFTIWLERIMFDEATEAISATKMQF